MKNFLIRALLAALILSTTLIHCQELTVQTESGKQTVLSRADIEALPHINVRAGDPPGTFATVSLKTLLEKAGVSFGESLRGKRLASYLLVEAADGYRVVLALTELDPAFSDKQIVLAFSRGGKSLDDKEGPYRIVIPGEKRKGRWVRQVRMIKIIDAQ
jgi:hypothetical protein